MHRAESSLWMRRGFSCLVCAVALACDSDLDWSVEDKLCTIEGDCLNGYVCSPEHKCIPIQVATARKPDAATTKSAAVSTSRRDATNASKPKAAADGGESREPFTPPPDPDASVPTSAIPEAGTPAAKGSAEMSPSRAASGPGSDAGVAANSDADAATDRGAGAGSGGAGAGGNGTGRSAPATTSADAGVMQPRAGVGGQSAASSQPETPNAGPSPPAEMPRADAAMPECGGRTTLCGSACIDVQGDPQHCGACDRKCSAPEHAAASCTDGTCEVRCDAQFTRCGNACVRLDADLANCGECGRVCTDPPGAAPICKGGQCGKQCNSGLQMCGETCVDLQRDSGNCNVCGARCPTSSRGTTSCDDGVCKLRCPNGQVACRGRCVADWSQCSSSIGITTPVGPLCLLGGRVCAGHCVSVNDDPEHCGECDRACKNTETCRNGRCAAGSS